MDRYKANVTYAIIWSICFTIIAIGCSFIWASVVNHVADDKAKTQQTQAISKGGK